MESEGAIAQLGERQLCKLDVVGSIPTGSTIMSGLVEKVEFRCECLFKALRSSFY